MEELKAKNIIENLESIAAEKGADALTGEIIEECCRINGEDPEDFKNFICENIDLQKIKELQGSEELLPEKLGQVAGGARPVKQGMASFLAATSLLGSAANFTVSAGNDALANAKRDIHPAQLIDLQKSVEQKNSRNKKKQKQKQSAWTGWDTLKYIGLGSFVTCASAVAYWAYSQKNSNASQRESSKEWICSPNNKFKKPLSKEERYKLFAGLLNKFKSDDLYDFYEKINDSGFVKTARVISNFTTQLSPWMVTANNLSRLNKTEVVNEIGRENVKVLREKLVDAHEYYLKYLDEKSSASSSWGRGFAQADPESSSSSSSQQHQPGRSEGVQEEVPEKDGSSDGSSAYTSGVGYSEYKYSPVELYWRKLDDKGRKGNRKRLTTNVDSGIERFKRLLPEYENLTYRYDASEFFSAELISRYTKAQIDAAQKKLELEYARKGYTQEQIDATKYVGPRFGCEGCCKDKSGKFMDTHSMELPKEVESVYDLPKGHCTVYDYGEEPINVKVGHDTCTNESAEIWICQMYSLPALFAVDAVLREQKRPGLNPEATVVQNAGNAVSPGGSILAGNGSQEESLMMDTDAYLFLNSKEAYEEYYLENKDKMGEALAKQKEDDNFPTVCAVKAWTDTGIFRKGIYCKQVGLIGARNGETINMIATAAADYNPKHDGTREGLPETYMGPIGDDKLYEEQLIKYWDTILKIAYENGNKNIVLTIGGGGAFNGKVDKIVTALRTVLQEYGCNANTPWKKCFKNIIIASDNQKAKEKFYDDKCYYDKRYYGSRCLITVSGDQKGITYKEYVFSRVETLQETGTILNTWTLAGTSTGSSS